VALGEAPLTTHNAWIQATFPVLEDGTQQPGTIHVQLVNPRALRIAFAEFGAGPHAPHVASSALILDRCERRLANRGRARREDGLFGAGSGALSGRAGYFAPAGLSFGSIYLMSNGPSPLTCTTTVDFVNA